MSNRRKVVEHIQQLPLREAERYVATLLEDTAHHALEIFYWHVLQDDGGTTIDVPERFVRTVAPRVRRSMLTSRGEELAELPNG